MESCQQIKRLKDNKKKKKKKDNKKKKKKKKEDRNFQLQTVCVFISASNVRDWTGAPEIFGIF